MIKANTNDENILREKLIELAILQYNKLYKHGKNGPDTFDCAGLVWFIYNEILNLNLYYKGIGISTTTKIMTNPYGKLILYEENSANKNLSVIKKGDIVFFHRQSLNDNEPKENNKYPGHCGIYLGDNYFIHCTRTKGKVIINNFDNSDYWKRILVASKDVISDNKIYRKQK